MTEPIVVARFKVTQEEYLESVRVLARIIYSRRSSSASMSGMGRIFGIAFVVGLVFALVRGYEVISLPELSFVRDYSAAMLISALVGFVVAIVWLNWFHGRRLREALRYKPQSFDVEVIADENGIRWNTPDQNFFWRYNHFDQLSSFKDGYYLIGGLAGFYVPGRGFGSEAEKRAFEALLKEKLAPEVTEQFFAAKAAQSR